METKQAPMNREDAGVAKQQAQAQPARGTQQAQAPAITPPVDVFEDENGITVMADLPGVAKENLSVHVEGEQLTIEGHVTLGESTKLDSVYAEIRVAHYRRTFALSRDLDTGKIDAKMKNGVLTLYVPKAEQARPRRIPVNVA
ncbi:MAG TPA: Hsp20/alpha crystallin family protein [Usitatibacter sp.]|nr:Hsp20/alpha crystallin family protein [Usitatibacter sp.]